MWRVDKGVRSRHRGADEDRVLEAEWGIKVLNCRTEFRLPVIVCTRDTKGRAGAGFLREENLK